MGLFDSDTPPYRTAPAPTLKPAATALLDVPVRHRPTPVAAAHDVDSARTGANHVRRSASGAQGAGWQDEIRECVWGAPDGRIGFAANYQQCISQLVAAMPYRIMFQGQPFEHPLAHYLDTLLGSVHGSHLSLPELIECWHGYSFTVGELFIYDHPDDPFTFDPIGAHLVTTKRDECTVRWTEDAARRGDQWEDKVDQALLKRSWRANKGLIDCTSPMANGLYELRSYKAARERLRRITEIPAVAKILAFEAADRSSKQSDPILEDYYEVARIWEQDPGNDIFRLPLFMRMDGDAMPEVIDLAGQIDAAALELHKHWATEFAKTQTAPSNIITGEEGGEKYANGLFQDRRFRERTLYPEASWVWAEFTQIVYRPLVAKLLRHMRGHLPGDAGDYSVEVDRSAFEHETLDPQLVLAMCEKGLLSRVGTAQLMGFDPELLLGLPEGLSDFEAILALRSAGAASAVARGDESALPDDRTGGDVAQLPPVEVAAVAAVQTETAALTAAVDVVPVETKKAWWE